MANDLTRVDPAWAWARYAPDGDRPWSRRLAAHLYRRAGFAANHAELNEAAQAGPAATLDRLCDPKPSPAAADFDQTVAALGERPAAAGYPRQVVAWWLYRMLGTSEPLQEKLPLFWHGHFATAAATVNKPGLMLGKN